MMPCFESKEDRFLLFFESIPRANEGEPATITQNTRANMPKTARTSLFFIGVSWLLELEVSQLAADGRRDPVGLACLFK